MVSDGAAVREVMLGDGGVLNAVASDELIIDMSTIEPATSRELASAAAQRGIEMLDAPVSGGDVGAREATPSIMVGGEADDLDRARPVLEALGRTITHVGPAGAGQVVKACNQIVVAITYAAVSEALVLASSAGVDRAAVLDVLSGGLAANRIMEMRRRSLLEHDFTPGFASTSITRTLPSPWIRATTSASACPSRRPCSRCSSSSARLVMATSTTPRYCSSPGGARLWPRPGEASAPALIGWLPKVLS